eukprot:209423_1
MKLIQNYCEHNDIKNYREQNVITSIPMYMQQLFYHLIYSTKTQQESIYINRAEYELLNHTLKAQLISFISGNDTYNIKLSPFLASFMQTKNIKYYQQFIWILDNEKIRRLETELKGKWIRSEDDFYYASSENVKVKLKFGIRKESSDNYTRFAAFFERLSAETVSGTFSVAVDEFRWFKNGCSFGNLSQGQYKSVHLFKDQLLDDVSLRSLTFRIAVYLH